MIRTHIARSALEMEDFRGVWERLTAQGAFSLFQRFDLNHLGANHFADRQPPFVVVSESDSGAAIIPACIDASRHRISLLGEELFDYRYMIWEGDKNVLEAAWLCLQEFATAHDLGFGFHAVTGQQRQLFDYLGLPAAPFTGAPYCLHSQKLEFCHPRTEARRRRLQRAGVVFKKTRGDTALTREIYVRKSIEPGSLFADAARLEMACAMAGTLGAHCEVFTLEADPALVAALITFRDGHWRRFYTTYYDRAWAKYSPGLVLLHEALQTSLTDGLDCDLMTGEQPYKQRLATGAEPLFRVDVSAAELRRLVWQALQQTA